MTRTIVLPPPMSTRNLPADVRRAMRAFERVHKMLEAKAAAEQTKIKVRGRRTTETGVAAIANGLSR